MKANLHRVALDAISRPGEVLLGFTGKRKFKIPQQWRRFASPGSSVDPPTEESQSSDSSTTSSLNGDPIEPLSANEFPKFVKVLIIIVVVLGTATVAYGLSSPSSKRTADSVNKRTTLNQTTVNPTTVNRTTVNPTTVNPTTVNPTTVNPTTVNPTTVNPTTVNPTTVNPTTVTGTSTTSTANGFPTNLQNGNYSVSLCDDLGGVKENCRYNAGITSLANIPKYIACDTSSCTFSTIQSNATSFTGRATVTDNSSGVTGVSVTWYQFVKVG